MGELVSSTPPTEVPALVDSTSPAAAGRSGRDVGKPDRTSDSLAFAATAITEAHSNVGRGRPRRLVVRCRQDGAGRRKMTASSESAAEIFASGLPARRAGAVINPANPGVPTFAYYMPPYNLPKLPLRDVHISHSTSSAGTACRSAARPSTAWPHPCPRHHVPRHDNGFRSRRPATAATRSPTCASSG